MAFSPSGARIAYEGEGFGAVWIARPDGSRPRLLARRGDGPVVWSPAGRLVAYQTDFGEVVVASADGRMKRRVGYRYADQVVWSPSGRKLALTLPGPGGSLRVVDFRGRHARIVAGADPAVYGSPGLAWSASGWLSYRHGGELLIIPANGGAPRSLASGLSHNFAGEAPDYADYAWSPDGSRVAFVRDGLWVMTVPDGTPRLVVPSEKMGNADTLQWSPDGRLIAYVRYAGFRDAGNGQAFFFSGRRHEVFTVPADGGEPRLFGKLNDRGEDEEFVVDIDWQARPRRP